MSGILRKTYPVSLKTVEGEKGRVEAIVSVFGNVDLGGDRVVKGAFAKSISQWKSTGTPVPVIFNHEWGDLWSHIGAVDSLEETEQGLKATYTLDVDDNPAAAQVYRLMKRGTLKEHSFAYSVVNNKTAKDGANELLDLDIIEVGPTLKGMNPDTEVLAVKSALEAVTVAHEKAGDAPVTVAEFSDPIAYHHPDRAGAKADGGIGHMAGILLDAKAGRTLSKANEAKLRAAMESISQVLSSLGAPADEETEKSDEDEAGKAVEAEASKSSDPELLSLITRIEQERN